eukprot:TRINITY_DN597_c0_g1::TRINITY_DN597_c0_g1_i1::g.10527::m.10527 TRINITY_DN597_c0_g1::TRINITY_DN597_c0_g1_i1::g.10527  ORF type:complete len:497 (+),score=38.24,sp/Q0JL75/P2C07_ORYSJ/37.10/2e-29,PP2C/PF00481.16/1.2e-05,PP2C/PF00481.16/3.1e-42,SpoIIE/PF07228.7/1.4,SpoIIE/PF07228.7/0.012,PP2C_2/PF13672.1/0.0017 TRINITY_DN597_c0_g1_i1:173-1663(+)
MHRFETFEFLSEDTVMARESKRSLVGFAHSQGRRDNMEDVILIHGGFRGKDDEDLYGIFDGFKGDQASKFLASHLSEVLSVQIELADRFLHGDPKPVEKPAERSKTPTGMFDLDDLSLDPISPPLQSSRFSVTEELAPSLSSPHPISPLRGGMSGGGYNAIPIPIRSSPGSSSASRPMAVPMGKRQSFTDDDAYRGEPPPGVQEFFSSHSRQSHLEDDFSLGSFSSSGSLRTSSPYLNRMSEMATSPKRFGEKLRSFEEDMRLFKNLGQSEDIVIDTDLGELDARARAYAVAIQRCFRQLSLDMDPNMQCGTTALCVYTCGELLYVANAGDTRCVLRNSESRKALRLSKDHKPSEECERRRIETEGGLISQVVGSVPRVAGEIAVSRALVTDRLRKQGIVFKPHIHVRRIQKDDEFLLLASDGLWDKVKDDNAVFFVNSDLRNNSSVAPDARVRCATRNLVERAYKQNSTDNISVICVHLKPDALLPTSETEEPTA